LAASGDIKNAATFNKAWKEQIIELNLPKSSDIEQVNSKITPISKKYNKHAARIKLQ
jgi:hypothetical protein